MPRYTPKQIEKYHRQKYIAFLEKTTKNLFRLLRDEATDPEEFAATLHTQIQKLAQMQTPRMDSEYLRQTHAYIQRLYADTCSPAYGAEQYANMREAEMSNLNRLQKLKNKNTYKKAKHRHTERDQDWG
jgi:hypothetical protein